MLVVSEWESTAIQDKRQTILLTIGRPCEPDWPPQPVRVGFGRTVAYYLRVVSVNEVTMGALTEEDAKDWACNSLAELRSVWNKRHPDEPFHRDRRITKTRIVYDGPPVTPTQAVLPI